jgi:hypothetical protein
LVAFSVQAGLSIVLAVFVFFLSKLGRLKVEHLEGTEEYKVEIGRLRIISRIIMIGNDVQLMLGK